MLRIWPCLLPALLLVCSVHTCFLHSPPQCSVCSHSHWRLVFYLSPPHFCFAHVLKHSSTSAASRGWEIPFQVNSPPTIPESYTWCLPLSPFWWPFPPYLSIFPSSAPLQNSFPWLASVHTSQQLVSFSHIFSGSCMDCKVYLKMVPRDVWESALECEWKNDKEGSDWLLVLGLWMRLNFCFNTGALQHWDADTQYFFKKNCHPEPCFLIGFGQQSVRWKETSHFEKKAILQIHSAVVKKKYAKN